MPKYNKFATPEELTSPSFFKDFGDVSPMQVSWDVIRDTIKNSEKLKQLTIHVREARRLADTKVYGARKKSLPAITPACVCCGGHKGEHVKQLSKCVPVDIDHIPKELMESVRTIVANDPHTFLAHVTASGEGLRVITTFIADTPEVAYYDAWKQCNEYYGVLTGIKPDRSTNDVTRLSFLCHDDDVFFNPGSKPVYIVPTTPETRGTSILVGSLQTEEDPFRLATRLVEKGGKVFVKGQRHAFLVCLISYLNKMGVLQSETLSYAEKHYGSHDENLASMVGNVYRLYSDEYGTWVRKTNFKAPIFAKVKLGGKEAGTVAKANAGDVEMASLEDDTNESASALKFRQLLKYCLDHQMLRYNVISSAIEVMDATKGEYTDLTDRQLNGLWIDCNLNLPFKVSPQYVEKITHSNRIPEYNPFKEYFDALPEWKPGDPDYIGELAGTVHLAGENERLESATRHPEGETADTAAPRQRNMKFDGSDNAEARKEQERYPSGKSGAHTRKELFDFAFRKWLTGMVAGLLEPGKVNQTVMIFIGKQGIFKSSFFARLLPDDLRRYFLSKTNSTHMSKDDKLSLAEFALICMEELDSMSDRDLNQIKALITTNVISERAAYDRLKSHLPHIATFCGTGNNAKFLTDLTGNRRWLPWEIESIDSPYNHPFNYQGIYSQALYLLNSNFHYWFSGEEVQLLQAQVEEFQNDCVEEELIRKFYEVPPEGRDSVLCRHTAPRMPTPGVPLTCQPGVKVPQFVSTADIFLRLSGVTRYPVSLRTIGQVMTRLGFPKKQRKTLRGYLVVERT